MQCLEVGSQVHRVPEERWRSYAGLQEVVVLNLLASSWGSPLEQSHGMDRLDAWTVLQVV